MGDASSLQRKLGAADTAMVSDYLESVREIERRVQMMKNQHLSNVEIPNAPVGIPTSFEDHLKIMFDLVALSYQINLTHVASMMMEKEVSMRTYTNIGVADAFHPLSHHGDEPEKDETQERLEPEEIDAKHHQHVGDQGHQRSSKNGSDHGNFAA